MAMPLAEPVKMLTGLCNGATTKWLGVYLKSTPSLCLEEIRKRGKECNQLFFHWAGYNGDGDCGCITNTQHTCLTSANHGTVGVITMESTSVLQTGRKINPVKWLNVYNTMSSSPCLSEIRKHAECNQQLFNWATPSSFNPSADGNCGCITDLTADGSMTDDAGSVTIMTVFTPSNTWYQGLSDDKSAFNAKFRSAPNGIIKRWCPRCVSSHQEIFYRRFSYLESWDAHAAMYTSWSSASSSGNELGSDMGLYSTYQDAIANTNR